MKLKNVPKELSNLPNDYKLDSCDKKSIKKYRKDKQIKLRKESKHDYKIY
jgi:hypothetical protein